MILGYCPTTKLFTYQDRYSQDIREASGLELMGISYSLYLEALSVLREYNRQLAKLSKVQ